MKRHYKFLIAFMLIAISTSIAAAQTIINFGLSARTDQSHNVVLSWTRPAATVSEFLVYRAIVQHPIPISLVGSDSLFAPIDSTMNTTYTDPFSDTTSTFIAYFVAARTNAGLLRSNIVFVHFTPPKDIVTFTSAPSLNAQVGMSYEYQADATSSDSTAVIHYTLSSMPAGMTISADSGIVRWTPEHHGFADVDIQASSTRGGRADQRFVINVAGGNGIVAGRVTDTTGAPIPRVLVKLFQQDRVAHFQYQTVTDSVGQYMIDHVDPGSYFVQAIPLNPAFVSVWYNNVRMFAQATAITVADSPAVSTVNFVLPSRQAGMTLHSVRGTVKSDSGAIVSGAEVVFVRAMFAFNASLFIPNDSMDGDNAREDFDFENELPTRDLGIDGHSQFVYRTTTDSTGSYLLRLPTGFYVASAWKPAFYRQFFNMQSSFLTATILTLNADTSGIDFALRRVAPVALGEIEGMVIDTASTKGVPSRIVAFREWWTAHDSIPIARVYFTDTDSLGNYALPNLPPGVYRIEAFPLGNFAPSFYSTNGPTTQWKNTTTITLDGNNVTGIDIDVVPLMTSEAGFTSIEGTVTAPASSGGMQTGLAGTIVAAYDVNGSVAGYAITDAGGAYTIDNLAPGQYSVLPDNSGYSAPGAMTARPTYDVYGDPQPTANVNFSMVPVSVTGIDNQGTGVPSSFSLDQNYPNPFNPSTQIRFSLPRNENVSLTIYNVLGQRVATLVDGTIPAGIHIITWDGRNDSGLQVSSGVYFYKLSSRDFNGIRKMILLR